MCGVFGITGHPLAKKFLSVALMALQHRGHDAAGVAGLVTEEPRCLETAKTVGKVSKLINGTSLDKFVGNTFIGHTRYSTRNQSKSSREIHPHWAQSLQGRLAIVTNGDMLNTPELLDFLIQKSVKTYTNNDAEVIAALVNYNIRYYEMDTMSAIRGVMKKIKGGYAGMIITEDHKELFAFRDPWGIRPLHVAEFLINGVKSVAFSSETCSFDIIVRYCRAKFPEQEITYTHRVVNPGEIIAASEDGTLESLNYSEQTPNKIGCVFESIYFSRPDSLQDGSTFQVLREKMGKELFEESPVEADLVTAVPKGGIPSAVGFAKASNIQYSVAILEEPSTGGDRSFTTNDDDRLFLAGMKYNILHDIVKGKRLVVVDDSIVRGTTMKLLVKSLFEAGAKEVHLRIPCPPYKYSCHYGIATKNPEALISYNTSVDEICKKLGATSLAYLTLDGLYKALEKPQNQFCDECLSGKQPFF
ncbi:MAG: amidophosphoribosyltransferase [bacterium]|jgi:amidophosphoribosyltransferase